MDINLTAFEATIKKFLDNFAEEDATFAITYAKKNKSIKECCQYIYQEVGKARKKGASPNANCVALSDEEVYGLAIHYWDEDSITLDNNVVKPSAVQATPTPATTPTTPAEEAPVPEEKPKTRKPRKPKAEKADVAEEVDPNIPIPFEMPIF